ncbi:unnamed protein product [Caenorhabditis bovis]|uniref:Dendritic cell-specific transmembrane protein-like domain-containing protein n=1 Tax=Caenorhabditis bovis TaxID=2654633 RepID=A0A8S1EE73_9PELO|nr:unnamed protein product [Caenorhabditis bovis]
MGFFDDPRRNSIRARTKTPLVSDYLIRSEVSDYKRIRLLINTIVGIVLCSALYYIGWQNLNFGAFDETYSSIIKWAIIGFTTYAFAVSPIFRCALLLVFVGAIGKQGQYPFTLLIVNNLHEGPLNNMIANYEMTSDIVMCHLELQSKIVGNRVTLLTGPIEQVIEKFVAKGTRAMKKVSRETREMLAPFIEFLSEKNFNFNANEVKSNEQTLKIEERKLKMMKLWEKSLGRKLEPDEEAASDVLPPENLIENVSISDPPSWTKFKSNSIRNFGMKLSMECDEMFNNGISKCRDMSSELTETCKKAIVWPIDWFICPKLNIDNICNRKVQATNVCRRQLEKSDIDPSVENDLTSVLNLTKELDDNTKIEMHSIRVETPRVEIEYRLSDMKIQARTTKIYLKNIMTISKQVLQAFFIYFVYSIFYDAVKMIRNYNNDVEFNNCFITSDFWIIDEQAGKKRLEDYEYLQVSFNIPTYYKHFFFRFPTKAERSKAVRPFFKWFAIVLTVLVVIIMDYYLYSFLDSVVQSARQQIKQKTSSSAGVRITGEGVLAEFLQAMTNSNETVEIDQTLSNEHCLLRPTPPNLNIIVYWLFIPLVLSFMFQVVFSFAIRRIILNFFLPYMFPKKSRVRLIYLYNKLLLNRERKNKENRARLRFITERRKFDLAKMREIDSKCNWIRRNIFHRIFKTAKCLQCLEKTYRHKLMYCVDSLCQATFCKDCITDNAGYCYACMVSKGDVNEEKTQIMAIKTDIANNFVEYKAHLANIKNNTT